MNFHCAVAEVKGKLVVGNWKMNSSTTGDAALIDGIVKSSTTFGTVSVAICPPYTFLERAAKLLAGSPIALGAQDVHWESSGAFTGEISPSMLLDIGVRYVIVGHSERRKYFGENDEIVSKKLRAAMAASLVPILCVGESESERAKSLQDAVVGKQLRSAVAAREAGKIGSFAVAYEPLWAIGTGKSATADEARSMHGNMRRVLSDVFGGNAAEKIPLLYGGSVKGANAVEFFSQRDVDGVLVGGASLKVDEFLSIIASGR